MANIFDYLNWRGDIPFSFDPFCAVDNLILSEIAYVGLDGIAPDVTSRETIPLAEASEQFFRLHSEEELRARTDFICRTPFVLQEAAKTRRFRDIRVGRYVNRISKSAEEQMSAMEFLLPDGTAYVAFRGTDDTIIGWKEDLNLSFSAQTSGQEHAAEYLSSYSTSSDMPLRVGGHSKGGNFAVYASAFCDKAVKERILSVYTNDGPGFLPEITEKEDFRRILPLVHSIIPKDSVFGLLLSSGYVHRVVESDNKGLMQHDGLSWQVLGNRFVEVPATSRASAFMEKTLQQWIESFSLQERADFSNAIYEVLTSGGADTLTDLSKEKLAGSFKVLNSFRKMNRQEQEAISGTLRQLVRSGMQTLQKDISEKMAEVSEKVTDARDKDSSHPAF